MNRVIGFLSASAAAAVIVVALASMSPPANATHEEAHDFDFINGKIGDIELKVWDCEHNTGDCATDTNAATICDGGQYLDGSGACVTVPTDTDTLGDLTTCTQGQTVAFNGTSWECADGGGGGTPPDKNVFQSSTMTQGDMTFAGNQTDMSITGVERATAQCNSLALAAGLPGEYLPWLGDSGFSPDTDFNHSSGRYVMLTAPVDPMFPSDWIVAWNWADLTNGNINGSIKFRDDGPGSAGLLNVWSSVLATGRLLRSGLGACGNWDSRDPTMDGQLGNTGDQLGQSWSDRGVALSCDNFLPIYCFEQ